jgi:hypothetical protein
MRKDKLFYKNLDYAEEDPMAASIWSLRMGSRVFCSNSRAALDCVLANWIT